ncbi:MAG: AbrB/MazE/SpoVT family DNA-binding domain-containing protein [Acidobacteriota bacterium]
MGTYILDKQGRITLPASFRESQGLKPGQDLVVLEEDGRLLIMTREQAIREAQAMVRKLVPAGVSLVEELFADRRSDMAKERAKEARIAADLKRLEKKHGRRSR